MTEQSLSLVVRLRRSTIETAHVSVPITEEVTSPADDGSSRKIDVDKIIEAALRLGELHSTQWELEQDPLISLHPVQAATDSQSIQ